MCRMLVAKVIGNENDATIVDCGRVNCDCGVDGDQCEQEHTFCEQHGSGRG
jgi:hypothetical protein